MKNALKFLICIPGYFGLVILVAMLAMIVMTASIIDAAFYQHKP